MGKKEYACPKAYQPINKHTPPQATSARENILTHPGLVVKPQKTGGELFILFS